jgi:ankyrin repeat protein
LDWKVLGVAIVQGQTEMAKLLVQAGFSTTEVSKPIKCFLDRSISSCHKLPAIHLAAMMGNMNLVDYFLLQGMRINDTDDQNMNPL